MKIPPTTETPQEIDWTSPPMSESIVIGKTYVRRNGERCLIGQNEIWRDNGAWNSGGSRHPNDLIREYVPPAPEDFSVQMRFVALGAFIRGRTDALEARIRELELRSTSDE